MNQKIFLVAVTIWLYVVSVIVTLVSVESVMYVAGWLGFYIIAISAAVGTITLIIFCSYWLVHVYEECDK